MCEQCIAKTEMYVLEQPQIKDGEALWTDKQEILPDYYLVRATVNGLAMKSGEWGLVRCDDPDFIFKHTPVPDKFWGLSDEQLDMLPDHEQDALTEYETNVDIFEKDILKSMLGNQYGSYFTTIGKLMDACKARGWNPDEVGMGKWLYHHIGLWISAAQVLK